MSRFTTCPICKKHFPKHSIEAHADTCLTEVGCSESETCAWDQVQTSFHESPPKRQKQVASKEQSSKQSGAGSGSLTRSEEKGWANLLSAPTKDQIRGKRARPKVFDAPQR